MATSSTMSLFLVDDQHILFAFNSRALMRRVPDDPPEDDDQIVTALLLEVPPKGTTDAKVLARTEWRLHDHARYLWPMRHGRFLLRQGLELRVLAPVEHLHTEQPLSTRLLMTMTNPPASIQISPDGELMVLQTVGVSAETGASASQDKQRMEIEGVEKSFDVQFIELNANVKSVDQLAYRIGGEQHSPYPLEVPITPKGYLRSVRRGEDLWHFTFGPAVAGAERKDLFDFISTCRPREEFVSDEEFLLGGCKRQPGQRLIGMYAIDGKELWRQDYAEPQVAETVMYADEAKRIAMSQIQTKFPLMAGEPLFVETTVAQRIRVIETRSGKELLRVDVVPMQADPSNFAISPDGRKLAVVNQDAIEIYDLPPPEGTPTH